MESLSDQIAFVAKLIENVDHVAFRFLKDYEYYVVAGWTGSDKSMVAHIHPILFSVLEQAVEEDGCIANFDEMREEQFIVFLAAHIPGVVT